MLNLKITALAICVASLAGCTVDVVRYSYGEASLEYAENAVEKAGRVAHWAPYRELPINGKESRVYTHGSNAVAICSSQTVTPSYLHGPFLNGNEICGRLGLPKTNKGTLIGREVADNRQCFELNELTHLGRPYRSIAIGYISTSVTKECP